MYSNSRFKKAIKVIFFYLVFFAVSSLANDSDEIHKYLKEFHSSPFLMMDRLPQQIINGKAVDRGAINFQKKNANNKDLFSFDRHAFIDLNVNLYSLSTNGDLAATIIDQGIVNAGIDSLDRLKLTSASLKQIPWADSYWPIYKGIIGIRYADVNFPDSKNFEDNFNYITEHSAATIAASADQIAIDQLSPSEKYDLLLGDANWTLTNYSWEQGQRYLSESGFIPHWMGICHGWSAAAHMNVAISHKPIVVESVNHIRITFYPSDIKALQSMLWANASPVTRFIGTKCKVNNPERNSIGRVIDPDCQNNNPASFHLILTNQLGINQRSFVMDGTYDAEVWNFPLTAYKYKYFNPQTLEPTLDYKQAMIPVEKFSIDKFKEFRSPDVRYVIGIAMDDTYVVEINPSRSSQEVSPLKTFRHFYDLELDANFQIIGGEWYANAHPDFIWTFDINAQAKSIVDNKIKSEDWLSAEGVPAPWTGLAQIASGRGQPVYAIIKSLLNREPQ